jgi:hypothetical protein
MPPFSDLSGRNMRSILLWLCALPAAVLAEIVVSYVLGAVVRVDAYTGSNIVGVSNVGWFARIVLLYALPASAFVLAGALIAPRRLLVAIVLTLLIVVRSLLQHLLIQHLAGRRVGVTNYTHFLAESAGALSGTVYIARQNRKNIRKATTP